MTIVLRNRFRCKLCNTTLESVHRHDYRTCECGELSVDGGKDYFRISGDMDYIDNLSVVIPSFQDMSPETTLALIKDFEEYNEEYFKAEDEAFNDIHKQKAIVQSRLAMYDRMFNDYEWITRIKDLCNKLISE